MVHSLRIGISLALAFLLSAGAATAQNRDERGRSEAARPPAAQAERQPAPQAERHQGPSSYKQPTEPKGWNQRPTLAQQGQQTVAPSRGPATVNQRPTLAQEGQRPVAPSRGPATVNRATYQHNYQAARNYKIGPYHPPAGWAPRRWAYGQILPPAYWASEYIIADYWLFGLEVPPFGYEWVRDGADAIMVSTADGQILQVEYGVFA